MKIIKPSFQILDEFKPITGKETANDLLKLVFKQIEYCGRTCYKSLDNIKEDSAESFVTKMISSKHYAMLEHGTLYLCIPTKENYLKYINNKYSKTNIVDDVAYITTNYRVIIENNWVDDIVYMCCPTASHEQRVSVKFICSRQVSHEFVRHRVFSFAQESTRYCNYTKDKFGKELTFIEPCWTEYSDTLKQFLQTTETTYFKLIEEGWQAQQAATVLPNDTKTELIMTGFVSDWKHFFDLRALGTTGKPHPQAEELAKPLFEEFIKRGYSRKKITDTYLRERGFTQSKKIPHYYYSDDKRIQICETETNRYGSAYSVNIDNKRFETVGGLDVLYVDELEAFIKAAYDK